MHVQKIQASVRGRSCQRSRYIRRGWLEHSVFRDKAYCFSCRIIGQAGNPERMGSEMVTIENIFNKRKVTLEKRRNLNRHEAY